MRAAAPLSCLALASLMAAAIAAPPGRSAFATRADLVCAGALAESAVLQERRADNDTAAAQLFARARLARRQADELARLPAGRAEEPRRQRLVTSFAEVAQLMQGYAVTVERGDREARSRMARPDGPAARSAREAREAAVALGLERCVGPV